MRLKLLAPREPPSEKRGLQGLPSTLSSTLRVMLCKLSD